MVNEFWDVSLAQLRGFGLALLDLASLAVVAGLVLSGWPPEPAPPMALAEQVPVACQADCIETQVLVPGS